MTQAWLSIRLSKTYIQKFRIGWRGLQFLFSDHSITSKKSSTAVVKALWALSDFDNLESCIILLSVCLSSISVSSISRPIQFSAISIHWKLWFPPVKIELNFLKLDGRGVVESFCCSVFRSTFQLRPLYLHSSKYPHLCFYIIVMKCQGQSKSPPGFQRFRRLENVLRWSEEQNRGATSRQNKEKGTKWCRGNGIFYSYTTPTHFTYSFIWCNISYSFSFCSHMYTGFAPVFGNGMKKKELEWFPMMRLYVKCVGVYITKIKVLCNQYSIPSASFCIFFFILEME